VVIRAWKISGAVFRWYKYYQNKEMSQVASDRGIIPWIGRDQHKRHAILSAEENGPLTSKST
jgi:hypothetical protein